MKRAFAVLIVLSFLLPCMAQAMCPVPPQDYKKHNDGWSYGTEGYGEKKVEGADPQSFHILDPGIKYAPCAVGPNYAADRFHVYFRDGLIPGADPATFSLLADGYARDANHVYHFGKPVDDADPKTFEQIASGDFYKDKAHVYYLNGTLIKDADPATFEPLAGKSGLARDAKHVFFASYYRQSVVPGANPKDVKTLGSIYWISNGTIFFADKRIPQVDAASFAVAKEGEYAFTAEDKNHYFSDDLLHDRILNKAVCKKIGPSVIACKDYILASSQKYIELDPASLHYLGMKDGWWTYEDKHGVHRIGGDGGVDGGSFGRDPKDFLP